MKTRSLGGDNYWSSHFIQIYLFHMFVKSDKAVLINLIAFNSKLLLFTLSRLQNEGHMDLPQQYKRYCEISTGRYNCTRYWRNTAGTEPICSRRVLRRLESLSAKYLCRCSSGFPSNWLETTMQSNLAPQPSDKSSTFCAHFYTRALHEKLKTWTRKHSASSLYEDMTHGYGKKEHKYT